MEDTIDTALANLRTSRGEQQIRDVVQVAGLIRLDRRTSFAEMFDGIPLRDQIALIVTAVIKDGGPATVTVLLETPAGRGAARTLARTDAMVRTIHDLFDQRCVSDATMTMTLGISTPFWKVVLDDRHGDRSLEVERKESLTTTPEEWSEVIVLRDGAESARDPGYVTRTLERAIKRIEENARSMPEGYHRHWQMVDAEVLRIELAERISRELC